MAFNGIPTLKIGGLTITTLRRLPSSKFTAVPKKVQAAQRSQDGTLYVQRQYTKYNVTITGLAQTLYEDLRYLYEQDEALDLYSLANRKEVISPTGSTTTYFTSRRIRTDDSAVTARLEYPEGTVMASSTYSILNGATNATLTFNNTLPAGTNVVIRYWPIIGGYFIDMPTADYDPWTDEESWSILFEEA